MSTDNIQVTFTDGSTVAFENVRRLEVEAGMLTFICDVDGARTDFMAPLTSIQSSIVTEVK